MKLEIPPQMNKNYINIVRKSLNSPKEDMPKNSKRIIFPTCNYKSESVFDEGNLRNKHKIKQSINFHSNKKEKKEVQSINNFLKDIYQNVRVISDSSCTQNCLKPSNCEITPISHEVGMYMESADYKEESGNEFELDKFSSSRDQVDNESFVETYSHLEDEFSSTFIRRIKIRANSLIEEDLGEPDKILHCGISSNFSTTYRKINHHANEQKELTSVFGENQHLVSESQCEINDVNFNHKSETLTVTNDYVDNISENNYSPPDISAKYFDFDDFILVILKDQKSISFYGNFVIKILKGQVEVLGSILDKSSKVTDIYSPRGYSLLVIKNNTHGDKEISIRDLYDFQHLKEKVLNIVVGKNSAVFLCFKMQNGRLNFIQKFMSQHIFPKLQNENQPQVIFEPKDNMNSILEIDEWKYIADIVNSSTKIFIAGGKGMGKSTLLRYIINKLLNKFEEIRVIDLDPGQAEFYVPGCLSVVNISEPCIGPNFTHIRKPER